MKEWSFDERDLLARLLSKWALCDALYILKKVFVNIMDSFISSPDQFYVCVCVCERERERRVLPLIIKYFHLLKTWGGCAMGSNAP